MKTFHYPKGHTKGSTLTAGELRAFLCEFPEDMPVLVTWEGIIAYLHPGVVDIADHDEGREEERCTCLIFDVNK